VSNLWSFDVLGKPSSLTGESVRSALRVLARHGFRLFSAGHEITGTSSDGLHELKFKDLDQALDWLAEQGGVLPIWHPTEPEIIAMISYAEVRDAMGHPTGVKPLRRLGLSLTESNFRRPRLRDEIAKIMRHAFMDLITAENPLFGYVYDEEILEAQPDALSAAEQHYAAVADHRPSPMVSWLNYFSPSYATALGIERLRQVDGLTEEAGGYVWQLTEYPWELTQSRLDAARRLWRSIFDV
jgi:hypothetical protein